MKSWTSETYCAECAFQIQHSIYAFNFPNNISRWGWTWHNLWNIVTVNLKEWFFHNSINWSRFYLQVYNSRLLGKIFRFTVFRLLGNAFVNLSLPLGTNWSLIPLCRKIPQYCKLANKNFLPHPHLIQTVIFQFSFAISYLNYYSCYIIVQ